MTTLWLSFQLVIWASIVLGLLALGAGAVMDSIEQTSPGPGAILLAAGLALNSLAVFIAITGVRYFT